MAAVPELSETLLIASREELLRQIRMEGIPMGRDTMHMVGRGIRSARVRIYSELGADRVSALLAIPYDPNSTSSAGIIRLCANELEALIVEKHLVEHLPTATIGNANLANPGFIDEEGLTRQLFPSEVTRRVDMLELKICQRILWVKQNIDGSAAESSMIQGFAI